jgi:membrane protease YdiL (CAAX protease family)
MWLNSLAILGACAAGVIFGIFVFWIITKIRKTRRANQSDSTNEEKQTPSTITQDSEEPSLEQPLNQADYEPDIQRQTDSKTDDDDWLSKGIPEASASTVKKEDDDWLNADVEEVPTNVYKQQDDDWLNAENDQPLDTPVHSTQIRTTPSRPEIQVKQDGSVINITVTTAPKRGAKPEKKDDNDWLNAEVEEVPADIYKQQDDDWLNAEIDQFLETPDGSALNLSPINQREIQLEQDGSILNITVTASKKQDSKSEQTVISLKINLPPQDLPNKWEQTEDARIIGDYLSPTYASLLDVLADKYVEGPVSQTHPLMDEVSVIPVERRVKVSYPLIDDISIRPTESQVTERHALMDEIGVRPIESPLVESLALIDAITVRPIENLAFESHALMDEITVRPVQSLLVVRLALIDEIVVRPVENQVAESHALMDEISTKPSPSPVRIEYELLDDLITKTAIYEARKAKLSREALITKPAESPVEKPQLEQTSGVVESPVEKAEPLKPISVNDIVTTNPVESPVEMPEPAQSSDVAESPIEMAEPVETISISDITEFLKEKTVLRQAAITSAATGARKSSILSLDIPIAATLRVPLLSVAYLIAMVIAELTIYRMQPVWGVSIYLIILFSLIVTTMLAKGQSQRDFFIALGLAPLIRIFGLASPGILGISQYLWYIIASIPIIASIISVSKTINFSANDIGLNFNKPFIQFLVAISGIGLAIVDYWILKPAAWTDGLTIQEILFPAIVLLIFTGLIEELSFRGVIQRASGALGSYGWIFIAAVYAALQIWQGSILHCLFCFGVGLLFGWTVKKTRSISGVGAAHGFINIGLYLIFPHIF